MDKSGLLNRILSGAASIDIGRKDLATDGLEHAGRLFYEDGLSTALACFKDAETATDPKMLVSVELTFLQQEFQFCSEQDTDTRSSLTQAIQSFEDALRCLTTVEDSVLYRAAETTYPASSKYRHRCFPKDAFHLACIAHRTRLRNSIRTPGVSMMEKAVLQQRVSNMIAAQGCYFEKQGKAFKADPVS